MLQVCPGPNASGFQARAAMQHARLFRRPAMDAQRAPGPVVLFSPRFVVRRIAGWLNATA
jgi:hypothetical protein